MGVLSTIILVICVIVCVIIVLLVLVQNEDEMGSFLGGASSSAFGARSASALAKITRVAVGIFFVLVLSLALLNRSKGTSFKKELEQQKQDQSTEWWKSESSDTNKEKNTETNSLENTEPANEDNVLKSEASESDPVVTEPSDTTESGK